MKKLFFSLTLVVFLSCSDQNEKPATLISKDKMSSVLIDYHIAERLAAEFSKDYDSNKTVFFSSYYPDLLEKHGVSKTNFEASFDYYSKDLDTFKEIYGGVEKSLIAKRDSLEIEVKNR